MVVCLPWTNQLTHRLRGQARSYNIRLTSELRQIELL